MSDKGQNLLGLQTRAIHAGQEVDPSTVGIEDYKDLKADLDYALG